MKTLVFFRRPLVPVFWPSMGWVGTVVTVNSCVTTHTSDDECGYYTAVIPMTAELPAWLQVQKL